jgi:hypothetical protein
MHNLLLLSLSTNWCCVWLVSRQCTWCFMGWLNDTVHMPGMKTGLWLGNFPNIFPEIFVLNSTITVCHSLLYHTCCLNDQEPDGKVATVMMRVTAYNLPPNFHFVYIVFIIDKSTLFLHTFCILGWHSLTCTHIYMAINGTKRLKSKMNNAVKLTHVLNTEHCL